MWRVIIMKKIHKVIIIVLLLISFISILLGIVYANIYSKSEKSDSKKESFEDYLSHCGMNIYQDNQYLNYITNDSRYFISLNILRKDFQCDISDYKDEWNYCDLDRSGIYISLNDIFPISVALNGCVFPKK